MRKPGAVQVSILLLSPEQTDLNRPNQKLKVSPTKKESLEERHSGSAPGN
jgi:hypothetical protein